MKFSKSPNLHKCIFMCNIIEGVQNIFKLLKLYLWRFCKKTLDEPLIMVESFSYFGVEKRLAR